MTSCAQCGLPAPEGARFCCYGCELCHQIQAEARDDHARLVGTMSFTLVLSMIVMMLSLFLYAEDVFDASGDVEMAWLRGAYRWASFVLATPVLVLAGAPLAKGPCWGSGAFAFRWTRSSWWGRLPPMFSRSIPFFGADMRCISILRRRPSCWQHSADCSKRKRGPARVARSGPCSKRRGGGCAFASRTPRLVSSHEVEPGMRIEVDPGQIIPVDLRLEIDAAELDLSVLTGESRPVRRLKGETLPAGAVPVSFAVTGTALTRARDSAVARLARLAASLQARPSISLAWADSIRDGA